MDRGIHENEHILNTERRNLEPPGTLGGNLSNQAWCTTTAMSFYWSPPLLQRSVSTPDLETNPYTPQLEGSPIYVSGATGSIRFEAFFAMAPTSATPASGFRSHLVSLLFKPSLIFGFNSEPPPVATFSAVLLEEPTNQWDAANAPRRKSSFASPPAPPSHTFGFLNPQSPTFSGSSCLDATSPCPATTVVPARVSPKSVLVKLLVGESELNTRDRFDVASEAEDGSEYSGSGGAASNRASNTRSSHEGTASTVSAPGAGGRFSAATLGSPAIVGSPGYRAASGGGTSATGESHSPGQRCKYCDLAANPPMKTTKTKHSQYPAQEHSPCLQRVPSLHPHLCLHLQAPRLSFSNSLRPRTSSHIPLVPSLNAPNPTLPFSLKRVREVCRQPRSARIFPAPKSPTSPMFLSHAPLVFSSPFSQFFNPSTCECRLSNTPSLAPSSQHPLQAGKGTSTIAILGTPQPLPLSATGTPGGAGSPEIPPVSERKDDFFVSPRWSMDRQRVCVDSGDSIDNQRLVHTLSVVHRMQDSDASVYTQGSRASVQPRAGFGTRPRLHDVEEIPKEKSARLSFVAAAGSLRSSPSLPASCLCSSPSLQASSLRSPPSIGAGTLHSRSNSNATTLEGGGRTRSRSNSTHHRPPPLALTNSNVACANSKSNSVSASSTAPTTTTTAASTGRDSSTSTSSDNSASVLAADSPLLHASWGSPLLPEWVPEQR
ncbi:hypothetical protein BKA70DRAFT_1439259 [Coprinopsis sp. MPI-PUGE-AT-0042]|nr:hypothetical protein BKA70DRAFT_1439259 [Coprinopsis sp. MPI-PUGE-AT-0042]